MDESIYHYTSLEALLSILQKDKICLRATRYDFFEDTNEYTFALSHLYPIISKMIKDMGEDENTIITIPYILCFCEDGDNYKMWKSYGSEGKGISMEFARSLISKEADNYTFDLALDVVYVDSNDESDIWKGLNSLQEFFDNNMQTGEPYRNLYDMSAYVKTSDYAFEHEYRYCRLGHDASQFRLENGQIIECQTIDGEETTKYRVSDNKRIPYREIFFAKECLTGIKIGPELNFEDTKKELQLFLEANNYNVEAIKITESDVLII